MILLTYWPWHEQNHPISLVSTLMGQETPGGDQSSSLLYCKDHLQLGEQFFCVIRCALRWPVFFSDKGIGCKTTWKLILYRFSLKGWAFFGHRAKFRVDIQSFFEVPHALMWHNLCAVGWPCQPDFETMRNQERKADSWQPWKSFKLLSSNLLHDNTKIQEDLRWVTLVLYIAWLVQGTYYILLSWIKSTNFIPKLRENEGGLFAGYWTTSVSIQLNQNQYIHI